MLADAVPGMAGNATAIGDAIGMGVRTLRERPSGSRVLILLTDGEDNSSSIPPWRLPSWQSSMAYASTPLALAKRA